MANKFWMIWCGGEGGRAPVKTHADINSAITEARRLSSENPAKQFYVLESMVMYEGEVIVNSRTCSSPESKGQL